jgi:hypothetical protein
MMAAGTTHEEDGGVALRDDAAVLLDVLDLLVDDVLRRAALENDDVACSTQLVIPAERAEVAMAYC